MGIRSALAVFFRLVLSGRAVAEPRWMTLPDTPTLPRSGRIGTVQTEGARIWFASFGHGRAVTLLHGGLANSNYWGFQIRALARRFRVIVIDSRAHGRSTNDGRPLSYERMAKDVTAVLEHLNVRRTAIIGWSDGAIVGLYLAIQKSQIVSRLFAFAGNYNPSGVADVSDSSVFKAYFQRTEVEYKRLSSTPDRYQEFLAAVTRMSETQPNIAPDELRTIRIPVWIVDGDRDEAIKRSHTEEMASFIPGCGLLLQPEGSHFSFLQDPAQFSQAVLHFLDER
jgi:pimeloyl-ACP methyl ester carboxylesterase